ncbi:MAG: N-acetyl-gamma-glutamyl-phosphate reductase [Paramuribaculum sp.]|nr:N-acetyl-gamma-glutamyl-phosphate reductase [Paramuribaculum sp.]
MIKVGIVGAAGYTAGELLRLLVHHPEVEIARVYSSSHAGELISNVHPTLTGDIDMSFEGGEVNLEGLDCLFLCSGHGASSAFWAEREYPAGLKVIDLAQDFRDETSDYVYGLPELQREMIKSAERIANPGCFATAIELALLPLASSSLLTDDVQITGITGSTGAGVKPSSTTHFSWRNDNLSVYKVFTHQHLAEINRTLRKLMPELKVSLNFIPVRGDYPRGIFVMAHTRCDKSIDEIKELYKEFYASSRFTHVVDGNIDMKMAVNTNKAFIGIGKSGDRLLVTCAIDNLLKGASGQAVQNMNLMFGLPEDMGLKLKASTY